MAKNAFLQPCHACSANWLKPQSYDCVAKWFIHLQFKFRLKGISVWRVNLFAFFLFSCRQGISYSYTLFCYHFDANFLRKTEYYCQNFEAELKIICVAFRNFSTSKTYDTINLVTTFRGSSSSTSYRLQYVHLCSHHPRVFIRVIQNWPFLVSWTG